MERLSESRKVSFRGSDLFNEVRGADENDKEIGVEDSPTEGAGWKTKEIFEGMERDMEGVRRELRRAEDQIFSLRMELDGIKVNYLVLLFAAVVYLYLDIHHGKAFGMSVSPFWGSVLAALAVSAFFWKENVRYGKALVKKMLIRR